MFSLLPSDQRLISPDLCLDRSRSVVRAIIQPKCRSVSHGRSTIGHTLTT